MPEKEELELYQLFKRNRIALLDPTYDPSLQMTKERRDNSLTGNHSMTVWTNTSQERPSPRITDISMVPVMENR